MKKTKLLYFISEDDYFLTHKLNQAKSAIKNKFEVLIVCKFYKNEKKIKALGFKTKNLNLDRKSINPLKELFCLIEFGKIVYMEYDFNSGVIVEQFPEPNITLESFEKINITISK